MKKIKVLQMGAGDLVNRGVEQFIMNLSTYIDHEKFVIDVLTPGICKNEKLKRQVESFAGEIVELNCTFVKGIRYYELCRKLSKVLLKRKYDVVQIQTGSIPILALAAKIAKKAGVPIVISHSANTHILNWKYMIQRAVFFPIVKYADYYWGCSTNACKDSFPCSVQRNARMIPYGIDVRKFRFDSIKRETARKGMNISDKLVVGHIGAFTEQKNHEFLLRVFKCLHILNKNTVLLLVGEGERVESVKKQTEKLELTDSVIFYGSTEDVTTTLSIMDVFCFPSKWEGLGIAMIEAQASGLPCVVSKALQPETVLTNRYWRLDLKESVTKWAERILQIDLVYDREAVNDEILKSDFNIDKVIKYMESIYADSKIDSTL